MANAVETPPELNLEKMTKQQKLAALLVMMGPQNAAELLKVMEPGEVEVVSAEMTKLGLISQEVQQGILQEFSEVAVQASTALRGGVDYTRHTLEQALGLFKASDIVGRVSPMRTPVAAMQQVIDMDARNIVNLVKAEQPQTIALIISYLTAEKASQVLAMLRSEVRETVVERLASMAPIPVEVVEKVVEVLNLKLGGKQPRALNQTGGIKNAADVLNSMDKNLSKSMLISLEERNPELGQAIRQKMFTFEDLAALEPTALQKVLREVDMRDLAVSLKTANEVVKVALLGSISKRAAETVKEEIAFMGPLKLKDIEAAQQRIIEVVRRLESEGEIETGGESS
ncbi:flagellar motor switch protein FliG [bacterium]|nr:flagellar motor switch protein FliG [bacterium]